MFINSMDAWMVSHFPTSPLCIFLYSCFMQTNKSEQYRSWERARQGFVIRSAPRLSPVSHTFFFPPPSPSLKKWDRDDWQTGSAEHMSISRLQLKSLQFGKKKTPLRGNVRCVLLYQNALLRCSLVLNGQRQPRARARAGASTSVKSVCTDCSDFFFFLSSFESFLISKQTRTLLLLC